MKTTLILLVLMFIASTLTAQEEKPYYKYLGNGKWETNTPAVRIANKNIEEINSLKFENEEYKQQLDMYKSAYDSARAVIANDKEIIKKKDEIIGSKMDLIMELSKPVTIEVSVPLVKFSGIYFNVGTEYDNREKFDVNTLKYFISAEASLIFKDRIKLTGEQKYPVHSSLKLGVVF